MKEKLFCNFTITINYNFNVNTAKYYLVVVFMILEEQSVRTYDSSWQNKLTDVIIRCQLQFVFCKRVSLKFWLPSKHKLINANALKCPHPKPKPTLIK